MASKGSERIAFWPVGVWADASKFAQFTAVAWLPDADGGESITIQLRKATDAAGSGATNWRDAVTVTLAGSSPAANELLRGAVDGRSDQLGLDGSDVPYTHVSFVLTDSVSPNESTGLLIGFDPRYSNDTVGGEGNAGL